MESWVIFAIGVIAGIFMTVLMVVASNASDLKNDDAKIKDISDETRDTFIGIQDRTNSESIVWARDIYFEDCGNRRYIFLKSKFSSRR